MGSLQASRFPIQGAVHERSSLFARTAPTGPKTTSDVAKSTFSGDVACHDSPSIGECIKPKKDFRCIYIYIASSRGHPPSVDTKSLKIPMDNGL